MIEVHPWMQQAVALLKKEFSSRLLFVGLQGSHRRGEAREDSDIDILVILDTMSIADLAAYRAILRQLPEGEKAGGFTCGRKELAAWPSSELFQFAQDTDGYYGNLEDLLPPITREDTVSGARMGISALYHFTAYLFLSGDEAKRAEELNGLYKSFFFSMQLVEYLRSGTYARTKSELLSKLSGNEVELLRLSMDAAYFEEKKKHCPNRLFELLLTWAGNTMRELAS